MNNSEQRLDSLLDKARSQPDLVSVESVPQLIQVHSGIAKPFNYKAMTLISSTLVTAVAAVYFIFPANRQTTNTQTKQQHPAAPAIQAPATPQAAVPPLSINPVPGISPVQVPVEFKEPMPLQAPVLPEPPAAPEAPESPAIPLMPLPGIPVPAFPVTFSDGHYIRLSDQELLSLGIVYKEGILVYKVSNTGIGDVDMYKNATTARAKISKRQKAQAENPVALFITDASGRIVELLQYEKREKFAAMAPSLLPVWVSDAGQKEAYVFWFENEALFTKLLPETVRQTLATEPLFYSNILPDQTVAAESKKPFPSDTTTIQAYDPAQLVVADENMMERLGIVKTEGGFHFKRRFNGKSIEAEAGKDNTLFNQRGEYKDASKQPSSVKQLIPGFMTDARFSMHKHLLCFEDISHESNVNTSQYFLNNRHKYVVIQMPVDNRLNLFWYKASPALMKMLKAEDRQRVQAYLDNPPKQPADISIITPSEPNYLEVFNEDKAPLIEGIKTITLSPEQLKQLRISITKDKGVHFLMAEEKGAYLSMTVYKNGVTFDDDKKQDTDARQFSKINPKLVTDDYGKMARIAFNEKAEAVNTSRLIPVLVRSGDSYTAIDKLQQHWRPDVIFWYEPTPEFLAMLDAQTAKEISSDLAAITQKEKQDVKAVNPLTDTEVTPGCKYFELCRNVKGTISSHNMYPNPAQQSVNIDFKSASEADIKISVTDINGKMIQQYMHHVNAGDGANTFTMSLSGLDAGIYLVYIQSDKGDYLYERLIKN